MITNFQMIDLFCADTLIGPEDIQIKFTDRQPRTSAAAVNTLAHFGTLLLGFMEGHATDYAKNDGGARY